MGVPDTPAPLNSSTGNNVMYLHVCVLCIRWVHFFHSNSPVEVFRATNSNQAVCVCELSETSDFIVLFKGCTDCHDSANQQILDPKPVGKQHF